MILDLNKNPICLFHLYDKKIKRDVNYFIDIKPKIGPKEDYFQKILHHPIYNMFTR